MAKKVKVTLVKSTVGSSPYQKKVVEAMGLRKIRQSVELEDCAAVRGSVAKVPHLLKLEEL